MLGYIIKTIKEIISRKQNIVFLVMTVLLVGAFALTYKTDEQENAIRKPNITIGVVDNDGSIYSSFILDYFKKTPTILKFANIVISSEKELKEQFDNGELLAYIVVPEGFADKMMSTDFVSMDISINTSNLMYSVLLKNMLDSYGGYITNVQTVAGGLYQIGKIEGMSKEAFKSMNWSTSLELVQLALSRESFFEKTEVEDMSSTPILQYYIWAILTLLLFLTATITGGRFLKERQLGTYERLRIAGHSIRSISLVILVFNSLLWMIGFNVLLSVISTALHCDTSFQIYVFIDLSILFANVFFLFLSCICRNSQQYAVLCTFGLMLISIIGGVLIPISFLPETFLLYSKMTPTYYLIENLICYSKGTNTLSIGVFSCGIILACFLLYTVACLILSKQRNERRGSYDETVA